MRKLVITCIVIMVACYGINAQERDIVTLEEAILIGLENNYGVKIARNNAVIAEREVQINRGDLFMPAINAIYTNSYSREDVVQQFDGRPEPNEIDGALTENENYSIVGVYFFDPSSIYTIQRLGKLAEVSELDAKVMVENTVASISSAYYRLVLEQQLYKVLETTLELSQSRLNIAEARYELGGAGRRDFLTAKVDYNADRSQIVNQDLMIKNARVNLNELLALSADTNLEVNDTIIVEQNLLLGDLLENAYIHNKQFLLTQRLENAAYLAMREAQAQRLPTITLNGAYINNTFTSQAGFLLLNQRQGFNGGGTINFNIFNGFTVNRRIQNAKVDRLNAEFALKDLEVQMTSDIQRAYNTYNTNRDLLEIEYSNYQVATENADIALERFRLGISDYLQFRDAQVNLLTAENRLLIALYNIKEMEVELMRLSGRIYYQGSHQEFSLNLDKE